MKVAQTISGLVLILIGALFWIFSRKLGLGGINAPGPGLVPFGAACLLILFSIGTILESLSEKKGADLSGMTGWHKWKPLLFVLVPLFVYTLVLKTLGFLSATFLILLLLFKISERHSWTLSIVFSLMTTAFAYMLFGFFLKIQFPRGLL